MGLGMSGGGSPDEKATDRGKRAAAWALAVAAILGMAGLVSALARSADSASVAFSAEAAGALPGGETAGASQAGSAPAAETAPSASPFAAERVVKALAAAYPDRIQEVALRSGDWMLRVDDVWYIYAEGRLLPEASRSWASDYSPHSFYTYPRGMPDYSRISDQEERAIEKRLADSAYTTPQRHPGFFDALWRSRNAEQSSLRTTQIRFLGFRVTVHQDIAAVLGAVSRRIESLRATRADVDAFVRSLDGWAGWNWRVIYGTRSRSFHSYGVAIDMLVKGVSAGRQYWQWSQTNTPGWYRKAVAGMYRPPQAVVEAFEAYGFVWGGKWPLFDAMHFEYRPEMLLLNGFQVDTPDPQDQPAE